MNPVIFNEADLPLEDLAAVGLVEHGRIRLEEADLKALLSGRRTNMVLLENLEHADMKIASLKAKLSLVTGPDGKPELLLHPEYVRSTPPTYLNDNEIEALETGEETMLEKDIIDGNGQRKRVLVEFDRETNQFLETDQDKLQAPDEVNGYALSPEQKARFKRGQEVEAPDGTRLRASATTREGIRANRIALIASIVFDGGISYLLFYGIKALVGEKQDARATELSPAYEQTLAEARAQQDDDSVPELLLTGDQYSRGYGRTAAR